MRKTRYGKQCKNYDKKNDNNKLIKLQGSIIKETDKSILLDVEKDELFFFCGEQKWLPKKLTTTKTIGGEKYFFIPRWLHDRIYLKN